MRGRVRKGLSVLESGNKKRGGGVLLELIDSRCVWKIN